MRVLNLVTNEHSRFFEHQVATLERRGVDCTTIEVPGTRDQTDDNTNTRSATDYLRLYPRALRASFGEYDLLHANYGLTAPAALAQPNLPVVVSLWGSDLMGRFGRVSKWCAEQADAAIVMSDQMAEMLDCPADVIPHGVDLDLFEPAPQQPAREAVDWHADTKHVLFPYPAEREVKNYPRAKRVVERVRQRYDGAVELQTLYNQPHERMPTFMNAADALLLTSRREGSPNATKEALACNLPVVTTPVGDVREQLAGVEPSAVCETDDQLVDALLGILRVETRSNGREAAREMSVEQMGEDIEAVYRRVTGKRPATVDQAFPHIG